jgi:flagellar protein FlaG
MSTTPIVSLPQNSATQLTREVTPPAATRTVERGVAGREPERAAVERAGAGAPTAAPANPVRSTPTDQPPADTAFIDRRTIEEATKKVQQTVSMFNSALQFQIDQDTEKVVIKIIDTNTKEVIKQIPPQEILEIAKALDKLQGLLVREKA